jgi:hypothetical protein
MSSVADVRGVLHIVSEGLDLITESHGYAKLRRCLL